MSEAGTVPFRETLRAHLLDHAREPDAPFDVSAPEQSDSGDVSLTGPPGVAIEVEPDGVFPRERAVVERARTRAATLDADLFATCTSTDLFLFHRESSGTSAPDDYYLDLRDRPLGDTVPAFLDAVRTVRERGRLPEQPARERVLGTLRSYHAAVWPAYRTRATEAYGRDEQFTRAFDAWVRTNGHARLDRSRQFEVAAKQYAHLLASGVLCVGTGAGPDDTREAGAPAETVLAAVDHPAFESSTDLFVSFPRTDRTERLLADLAAAVERGPVERLDGDLAGTLYEELLPEAERKQLGQYYTPPDVAETVCAWAVRPTDDRLPRVLDPAAGSGTFALAACDTLGSLDAASTCGERLDSLAAVDVSSFPLHLTALNLAGRYGRPGRDHLALYHDSFFDLAPDGDLGRFDAVVGNPPYIRQEDVPETDRLRSHLAAFGPPGTAPYEDGPKRLSERSDAYVYFVTHATRFLRDGGRLGFVLPTKWLTTRYGESFQEFLYDFYRVEAVVGFSARAFEDALVDTALLLAERCEDETARREATTNFVRIEESMAADDILDVLSTAVDGGGDADVAVRSRPASRTVAVDQARLADAGGGKLAPYLQAPAEFIGLLEHPLLTELGALGDVHRGVMTGANDFFFLDGADRETWDLPDRFLAPAVKSNRDVEGQVLRASDSGWFLFDVHDYVARVERETPDGADLETRVRDTLARDGYEETLRYVEWGESEAYHERQSCASRRVWFDLGALEPPEVLHPKFFDERVSVVWNPDSLVPGNAVDCVSLAPDVDEAATMGVLNSTVHEAMLECWGRAEGGGALQLMTYEVTSLPVLDVRALAADARERIADCNERLVAGAPDAREDLDRAVLDALDVGLSVETLHELHEAMVRRRVSSAEAADVLVGQVGE